ncbi:MAG: nucleotide exchange factor GrpE [Pseudomonadota bacterium]
MTEDAKPSPDIDMAASDPTEADARLAELEAENANLKDRTIRALADIENLRKRSEREVRDAGQYAITKFAGDMLTVADNLRRAIESMPQDQLADQAVKTFAEGVDMTERELLRVLERHGVRKLEPKGERFDPNFHQAMFEIPDEATPAGTVVEVVQSGFAIGDRVLRAALVGVSKGGPKRAPTDATSAEPSAAAAKPDAATDTADHVDKTV